MTLEPISNSGRVLPTGQGGLEICPHLRLIDDPHTAAAFPRRDHSCAVQANKRLAQGWQQRYCVTPGHTACPFFIRFAQAGSPSQLARPLPRELTPWLGVRSLILIAIVFVALVALAALAFQGDFLDRLTGSSDENELPAGEIAVTETPTPRPTNDQEPTPSPEPTEDVTPTPEAVAPLAASFADPAFRSVWARTDAPIASGNVERSWIWGAAPISDGLNEPWVTAPSGERLTQYFPKGRLEIEDPDADPLDPWFVTPGLLALELVEGRVRLGVEARDDSPGPADIPIGAETFDDGTPTYAELAEFGLFDTQPHVGLNSTITQTIVDGQVTTATPFATYQITAAYFNDVPGRTHMIASVFWTHMNSDGVIDVGDELQTGPLFITPFYSTGFPITEPYWATVEEAGEDTDFLWQCFERRCLFYIPSNDPALQIESNDVGLHYYQWRYGSLPAPNS